MTEAEAAWLAGVLEGEGCFDWNNNYNLKKQFPRIRIGMTDEDVVRRVAVLCGGGGSVRTRKRVNRDHQTTFEFQLCAKGRLLVVLTAIRPWMGQRRGKLIDEMVSVLKPA